MKPSRLALVWCLYTMLFFFVGILLYAYIPQDWAYSKLSRYLEHIGYYVWDDLYMDILFVISMLLICVVMMLSAKRACRFINKKTSKDIKLYQVTPLELILILHAFAAVYALVLSLIFAGRSDIEFYETAFKYFDKFILETFGYYAYDALSLPFSLFTMSMIVVLVSSFAIRLSYFFKRWNHSPDSN